MFRETWCDWSMMWQRNYLFTKDSCSPFKIWSYCWEVAVQQDDTSQSPLLVGRAYGRVLVNGMSVDSRASLPGQALKSFPRSIPSMLFCLSGFWIGDNSQGNNRSHMLNTEELMSTEGLYGDSSSRHSHSLLCNTRKKYASVTIESFDIFTFKDLFVTTMSLS